jgi:hypothetical protein
MADRPFFTDSADSVPVTSVNPNNDFASSNFDPGDIRPARNVSELQGQVGQLITVFVEHEGREPGPQDSEFWTAYNALIEAFGSTYEPGQGQTISIT